MEGEKEAAMISSRGRIAFVGAVLIIALPLVVWRVRMWRLELSPFGSTRGASKR